MSTDLVPVSTNLDDLTAREIQVLKLVALGDSTKMVAATLGIASKTVDRHRQSIMGKTGRHTAVALTHLAIKTGLVEVA